MWIPIIIGLSKGVDALFFAPKRKQEEEQKKQQAARNEAAHRAQRCCADCKGDVAQGVTFCHQCRGTRFTTRGALIDGAAAEQRRKHAEELDRISSERARKDRERATRAHHDAVRKRCREFAALRYCTPCNIALEATHKFCTTCGASTNPLPTPFAFAFAHDEFPSLILTENDFRRFL